MSEELHLLTAASLLEGYRSRRISPVEAVGACLDQIEALQPQLNNFCLVDREGALAAARASEARWMRGEPAGKLDGVPTSIKDLALTKGWPTLCGSKAVDPNQPWTEDAPPVARLREAAAVFLGKTTTSEFGHKGVTDNPLTGVTRNPWNADLTCGGSSGGAGVATATGMAPLNLGSDGGGSIRIPASFCGVVGFKPGFARVPGLAPITGPLVTDGPLTRSVRDAALMMNVISAYDARDPNPAVLSSIDHLGDLVGGIDGWRIGFAPTISEAPVDAEVAAGVRAAVSVMADRGASVEEIAIDMPGSEDVYITLLSAGTAMMMEQFSAEQQAVMEPPLLTLARVGRAVTGVEYARAYHRVRVDYILTMRALYERFDLVVLPTMPRAAFEVLLDHPGVQDGRWRSDWTPFTFPFNLASLPACSLPCGLTAADLPMGVQIVGPWGADARVLRAANAFEEAVGPFPLPPIAHSPHHGK